MTATRTLAALTRLMVGAAILSSTAYLHDVPIATGLAVAAAHVALLFFLVDLFGEYAMCFPAGVFSSVAFLLWGPGVIPWGLAGAVVSFLCQYQLWRAGLFAPTTQLRMKSDEASALPAMVRFVAAGTRVLADWFAGMMLALIAYRLGGSQLPASVGSWQSVGAALGFLLIVNFVWLGTSQVRAIDFRPRTEDIPSPSFDLFVRALFGIYVAMPGTVLVLFTVQQFQDKGAAALVFWTAATLPFHFVTRSLLASSYAQYRAQRQQDRQREAVMLASQASMILHETVHQIGTLNLLLHLPNGDDAWRLAEAREVVRQLERTIDHFRLSLRRHEVGYEPVEIEALVEHAVEAIASEGLGPVAVSIAGNARDCRTLGDFFLLRSALGNVLRNAFEASAVRSPVDLSVARREDDQSVTLSVRDRGFGIAPADRDRVFDPSFSTKGKGLGLGLHLTREIVRAHGGRVDVEEAAEGGAVVTVVLPLATGTAEIPSRL